ncbi:hypothetical protein FOIG_04140 [Fusarium odoratissimum NRRL 54006]|uniref:Uncharacterized protein n=2 Tax=Fusarium oxysporum species complex TaxID=171631 RepID=X0JWJ7_FUSO5|nr:uncharacterized protein FOIG_04140 [Fusarium odoratissimum NRRL 54006]EXM05593.1 hypothetical protein FOIG_04140 [Fusarium odoratissimum NRRL 54006]TXB99639.1 hypothetical protein FocTR4_00014297 [Fusarium oxysporum f. sp. cubense]
MAERNLDEVSLMFLGDRDAELEMEVLGLDKTPSAGVDDDVAVLEAGRLAQKRARLLFNGDK